MAKARAGKLGSLKAAAVDQNSVKEQILRLEDEWMTARLRGDSATSQNLLDDTYAGATSRGLAQTKAEFIEADELGAGFFKEHLHSDRIVTFRGDVAISTGTATLSSQTHRHAFRYLRLYLKSNGGWKMVASQSTPIA